FLGRDYNSPSNASSQVAYEIDTEVRKIIESCHQLAKKIIEEHKADLIKIADTLMEKETLTAEEIEELLKKETKEEVKAEEPVKKTVTRKATVKAEPKTAETKKEPVKKTTTRKTTKKTTE
ncbi:MAG: cell division protein FtsH, partial [Erysipelotrichaceae bacterium]|nr:cell division protein FtsH [Erysipelotrichaceae bacterium]